MEKRICDTDEDVEYKKAVREFLELYKTLKKKRALRWSGRSDLKGAWIEIREYKNNGEVKTVCLVKAENSTDCYRMTAEQLKWEMHKENPCLR